MCCACILYIIIMLIWLQCSDLVEELNPHIHEALGESVSVVIDIIAYLLYNSCLEAALDHARIFPSLAEKCQEEEAERSTACPDHSCVCPHCRAWVLPSESHDPHRQGGGVTYLPRVHRWNKVHALSHCVYVGFLDWYTCTYTKYYHLLLPEARVGGHGYSSPSVCLFVCLFVRSEPAHLDAIALRLQHG